MTLTLTKAELQRLDNLLTRASYTGVHEDCALCKKLCRLLGSLRNRDQVIVTISDHPLIDLTCGERETVLMAIGALTKVGYETENHALLECVGEAARKFGATIL